MKITGTSCGGSSYLKRIMVEMMRVQGPIVVVIGKGKAQDQVFMKIKREIALMDNVMSVYCGLKTRSKITVRRA